jgi:hypothetical protein
MQKMLLGFLLGLTATSFALTRNDDGSVLLSADEVRQIEKNWYTMEQGLQSAYKRITYLTEKLDEVTKAKCI